MGAVGRHPLAAAAGAGRAARRRRPAATPTATSTRCAPCSTTAARAEERTGGRGALNFLEEIDAQDIAADTLTRRAARPDAVRLMTAHRSKGLEWRLVVVAGRPGGPLARPAPPRLPPGGGPDRPRRPRRTAHPRRAARRGAPPLLRRRHPRPRAPGRHRREGPRRRRRPALPLPHRARRRTPDVTGRPRRPLAVAALVAELRATTVDPARLRRPARRRRPPARPARRAHRRRGPARWCPPPTRTAGGACTSRPAQPVPLRDRDQPVALSGSALDQLANTCALQWFLGREVKADAPATAAQGFGNVVHVLADEVASGRTPADLDVLMERLDSVWDAPRLRRALEVRAGEGARPRRPGTLPAAGTSWTAAAAPPSPASTTST